MMFSTMQKATSILGLAAIIVIAGAQVVQISGTCSLGFATGAPTCKVADDSSQNFAYQTTVSWASQGDGAWTILVYLANPGGGISPHIKDVDSVNVNDNGGFAGSTFPVNVSGTKGGAGNRTSQVDVIDDDPTPDCSGGRSVTVKPFNSSC